MAFRNQRPNLTLAGALVCLAGALASCHSSPPARIGVRVVTTWDPAMPVDQLRFSLRGAPVDGGPETELLEGVRARPETPGGPALPNGAFVILNVAPPLSTLAITVRCEVTGLNQNTVVAEGKSDPFDLVPNTLKEITIPIKAPAAVVPPTNAPDGMACTSGTQCLSGFCEQGVCCTSSCKGLCLACNVAGNKGTCSSVPAGLASPPGSPQCLGSDATSCGFDGTCNGAGACRVHPAGTACRAGACSGAEIAMRGACDGLGKCIDSPPTICAPFLCSAAGATPACRSTCVTSADCIPGRTCVSGSCGKKFDGAQCGNGGECSSGFCASGVCCNAACDGTCSACNQAGAVGKCQPVAAGAKDPGDRCAEQLPATCGTTGVCDGKGACAKYAVGAICRPAACETTTILTSAGRCNDKGECPVGAQLPCAPFACDSGACKNSCTAPGDCVPNRTCVMNSCGPKGLGQTCTDGVQCASNFCVDGVCCDTACTGNCRSCKVGRSPGVCTPAPAASPDPRGGCKDTGASSCGTNGTCNGAGACQKYAVGTVCGASTCASTTSRTMPATCDSTGHCAAGAAVSCGAYTCNSGTCLAACSADANCAAPNVCVGGTCGLLPLGSACKRASDCRSASCTDGVCCQSMTCSACRACNIAGSLGTCAPIAAGTADARGGCNVTAASTCGHDGTCNGAGACRQYQAGTSCAAALCQTDTLTLTQSAVCDGQGGACPTGTPQACAPFTCDFSVRACRTRCASNADCSPPNLCNGNGLCGNFKALGQTCTSAAECAGGNCVDGVCCASSACGLCLACNVPGRQGTCAALPAGTTASNAGCAVTAATTCGFDGKCDGNGACRKYPGSTICAVGKCTGNTATPASTCDGQGQCVAATGSLTCDPYRCAGGLCPGGCTSDADCIAPAMCVGTTCQLKALGTSCTMDGQCGSGHCVDGNCCDLGACGKCRACNVTGFAGYCHALAVGAAEPNGLCTLDAPATCKQDGACDGAGGCRNYVAGTVCLAASCAGPKNSVKAKTCDGAGACQDNGTANCAPFACNAVGGSCFVSCADNTQCSGAATCDIPSSVCQ